MEDESFKYYFGRKPVTTGDEFDVACDAMTSQYLSKYNLKKSMQLINAMEGKSVISDEKIQNAEITEKLINNEINPSDAKKMVEWNNTLGTLFEKNPMVLDYIIL